MKNRLKKLKCLLTLAVTIPVFSLKIAAQDIKRERPAEWNNLVRGAAFIDQFKMIPPVGELTSDTWGWDTVLPRYTDNGIEEKEWSYWGGNIMKGEDNLYHLFVCRWPENNKDGHKYWSKSEVVHAVCSNSIGPYKVKGSPVGKGHNPEIFRLKDGRYVIYVIDACYISDSLDGPWQKSTFEFQPCDRKIIEGLSNLSFTQREDGSYLMVCRGGGIWISKTGLSPYMQITNKRVYPDIEGRFEDPVIWRTGFQYHMIVNDWYGRIAYYLRSKNGVEWKVEPGEAYTPGIAKYTDGTNEDWYKYERIKIFQDKYGRAVQANFAVIDTSKWGDLGNDRHSSKNISIPLVVERFISIQNKKPITEKTKSIVLKIQAEEGFDPLKDLDIESLRLGASEEVNFGRGCKVIAKENEGADLLLTFDGTGNGITENNFAAKLLGRTKNDELIIGYAQLPGVSYNEAILSALKPILKNDMLELGVQNFGQVNSKPSAIEIVLANKTKSFTLHSKIGALKPFEKTTLHVEHSEQIHSDTDYKVTIRTNGNQKIPLFEQEIRF